MVFPPVTSLVESPAWSSASVDGAVGRARYRARFPRSTGWRRVFVADGRRLRRALSSDIESPAAKADRTQNQVADLLTRAQQGVASQCRSLRGGATTTPPPRRPRRTARRRSAP